MDGIAAVPPPPPLAAPAGSEGASRGTANLPPVPIPLPLPGAAAAAAGPAVVPAGVAQQAAAAPAPVPLRQVSLNLAASPADLKVGGWRAVQQWREDCTPC